MKNCCKRQSAHHVIALMLPWLLVGVVKAEPVVAGTETVRPEVTAKEEIDRFLFSVQSNDLKAMQVALQKKSALANAVGVMGQPALMHANSVAAAKLLVDNGADMNFNIVSPVLGSKFKMPLITVIGMSRPQMLKYLASRGANLRARDDAGQSALIRSAEASQLESVRFLLSQKMDARQRNNSGQTALHAWAHSGVKTSSAIAQLLLAHGALINARDQDGRTPLDLAAEDNNVDAVRFLLSKKANATLVPKDSYSALHWAAENNSVPIAKMLLDHGAKINVKDESGRTPLMIATEHKSQAAAKYLRQRGAK